MTKSLCVEWETKTLQFHLTLRTRNSKMALPIFGNLVFSINHQCGISSEFRADQCHKFCLKLYQLPLTFTCFEKVYKRRYNRLIFVLNGERGDDDSRVVEPNLRSQQSQSSPPQSLPISLQCFRLISDRAKNEKKSFNNLPTNKSNESLSNKWECAY